jgi:hypothetical protein
LVETHLKTGTTASAVCTPYPPAVPLGNRFDKRQPQTHTAHALTGTRQPKKRLKNPLTPSLWHPRPMVAHTDMKLLALLRQRQDHVIAEVCVTIDARGTVAPCVL